VSKCVICVERPRAVSLFCVVCGKSYDRSVEKDTSIAAALIWAAQRARQFERARHVRHSLPHGKKLPDSLSR